jgi:outer membrane protein TolC
MRLFALALAAASVAAPVLGQVDPTQPDAGATSPTLFNLGLSQAVELGLDHNLAALLAAADVEEARGAANAARSRLRPELGASLGASRSKINLEAFGFPVEPGMSPVIGPFNVVDARAVASMRLLDLSATARARASAFRAEAAAASAEDIRDEVVLSVSTLYMGAVASDSRVAAARAQLETAQALYERAEDMRSAGVVAGVDVLRARVQLATEQQRLIVAENEAATRRLALAQAIGLPLDRPLLLVDPLLPSQLPPMSHEQALDRALTNRGDWRQAQAALAAAQQSARSARTAALPSLDLDASAGANGQAVDASHRVYAAAAVVRVPIYTGGLIAARRAEAEAGLTRATAVLDDLRSRIEYQVRTALLDLEATSRQTRVAHEAVILAETQLEQTRDRFSAGVADGVEVVQAQEAVAAANERYIAGLLADNVARVALARALGVATTDLGSFLGGAS